MKKTAQEWDRHLTTCSEEDFQDWHESTLKAIGKDIIISAGLSTAFWISVFKCNGWVECVLCALLALICTGWFLLSCLGVYFLSKKDVPQRLEAREKWSSKARSNFGARISV